jgi:YidC/Oxa1 family membrane protein insertase
LIRTLADFLVPILSFLWHWTGSLALAVVLLTLGVKLFLHPLTRRALKVGRLMQALELQAAAMPEPHRRNSRARREELMRLYRGRRINPFTVFVPRLIQIPVLWALLVIFHRSDFRGEQFLGVALGQVPSLQAIAKDLTLVIYPLLVAWVTYLQEKLFRGSRSIGGLFFEAILAGYLATEVPIVLSIYWVVSALEDLLEDAVVMKETSVATREG